MVKCTKLFPIGWWLNGEFFVWAVGEILKSKLIAL
nr:MAG TPA: hypothetical protein [Caudoviricetes sp.]